MSMLPDAGSPSSTGWTLVRIQKQPTPDESLSDITKNFGTVHCQRLKGEGGGAHRLP
ncbi:hypothetical protein LY78DRAFT_646781 [Colletotrichum sublineola]|nr:hypothetical protein LY78DRAFT_646781 [Colletotrichum sublineola]